MIVTIHFDTRDPKGIEESAEYVLDLVDRYGTEANTPEEQPEPAEVSPEKTEPSKQADYTAEDIRTKVSELIKDGKRTEVKELLSQFNADTVTKLQESDYANFMAAASLL